MVMMSKSIKHIGVSLTLAAVLLLITALTAAADTHYQEVIYFDDAWTIPIEESPCDFPLDMHSWGVSRMNYWLDENGQTTKRIESFGMTRNTVSANGKSMMFLGQGPFQIRFEGNQFTVKYIGTNWLFIAQGYGKVFGFVGNQTWDCTIDPITHAEDCVLDKSAGYLNWDDADQFCEYLGG
jgi:hypothetical protein